MIKECNTELTYIFMALHLSPLVARVVIRVCFQNWFEIIAWKGDYDYE